MKAFLDTSVLVAAFYGDHQHHALSLDLLTRLDRKDGGCGAHSLIEVYSTLTRMPGRHRVSGEQAMLFIADVRQRLTVIALNARGNRRHARPISPARTHGRRDLRCAPGSLRLEGPGADHLHLEPSALSAMRRGSRSSGQDSVAKQLIVHGLADSAARCPGQKGEFLRPWAWRRRGY